MLIGGAGKQKKTLRPGLGYSMTSAELVSRWHALHRLATDLSNQDNDCCAVMAQGCYAQLQRIEAALAQLEGGLALGVEKYKILMINWRLAGIEADCSDDYPLAASAERDFACANAPMELILAPG
jgi:hypothetical protein